MTLVTDMPKWEKWAAEWLELLSVPMHETPGLKVRMPKALPRV